MNDPMHSSAESWHSAQEYHENIGNVETGQDPVEVPLIA